jgi:opacity protein-like surface antigen
VAQKVHQSEAGALKWPAKKVDTATGAQVKKLFVASVVVVAVALSAPVLAADMPPYPVAKGPIVGGFDWEGFYVGGHIGGAWENTTFNQTNVSWTGLPPANGSSSVNTGESGSLGGTSITGGLQIGYNWLIPGPFLFGLEADISGAGLSSTTLTSPPGDPLAVASWNEKVDLYGSVRARLGWVAADWLFYGTGGLAWDYDKFTRSQLTAPFNGAVAPFVDTNALQGAVITNSRMRVGWVAGLGVEWAIARTWTVKLEYLHFDTEAETLSGGHFSFIGPAATNSSASLAASEGNLTIDTVRIGFNHTFN